MPFSPSSDPWVVRASIALGTFVEVRLRSAEATEARFAAAFAAIAHVHRRMNAHDNDSDLGRISRRGHHRAVAVDACTFDVLQTAQRLFRLSDGRFDVTCGPRRSRGGTFDAITLVAPRHVGTGRPVALDLGGIAKGYAVDRGIVALRNTGATSGMVNAGGDLRVFGDAWTPLHLRDPRIPTKRLAVGEIRDVAVATSSDYFRSAPEILFERGSARPRPYASSITVVAPSCALADALTKLVALNWRRAAPLLSRLDAVAIRLTTDRHVLRSSTTASRETDRLRFSTWPKPADGNLATGGSRSCDNPPEASTDAKVIDLCASRRCPSYHI